MAVRERERGRGVDKAVDKRIMEKSAYSQGNASIWSGKKIRLQHLSSPPPSFFFICVFLIFKPDHSHLLKCLEIGAAGPGYLKAMERKKGIYLYLVSLSLSPS